MSEYCPFKFCPDCASKEIKYDEPGFFCPDCGFVYYHNTAAANGCIIQAGEKIVLLVRGKEPCLGKLDLPGGFVNPGEGILEGLYREIKEELGWEPNPHGLPLNELFVFFASFPNVYPYKGLDYNTCDMYFILSCPELKEEDLKLEADEIAGVRFLHPDNINLDELAFEPGRKTITAYREYIKKKYP